MIKWLKDQLNYGNFKIPHFRRPLPECLVRSVQAKDYKACLKIFLSHEGRFFPEGFFEDFAGLLRSTGMLFLVVESEGEVRAFGGVAIHQDTNNVCLSYGMVHPSFLRCGFGTTLLLARISALPKAKRAWTASLTTAGPSASFYQRFGFVFTQKIQHLGSELEMYHAHFKSGIIEESSKVLLSAGVKLNFSDPVPCFVQPNDAAPAF